MVDVLVGLVPAPRARFGRSAIALSIAALLGPVWLTYVPRLSVVTGARILLLIAGAVVAVDIIGARTTLVRPSFPALAMSVALATLTTWAAVSARLWGCFCAGSFYGLFEFTAFTVLVLAVGTQAPEHRARILCAAATGAVLAGGLALVGIRGLHSSIAFVPHRGSRLEGIYGNPNYLAYAVAFAAPVFTMYSLRASGRTRIAAVIALTLTAVVVLRTFSRSGLIAAAAGALVAVAAESRTRLRAVAVLATGTAAAAAVALLLHTHYREARIRADFGETVGALNARDRSGWDGSRQGVIPRGNSSLANEARGTVLRVSAPVANVGVSYPWGLAKQENTYVLKLFASASRQLSLGVALEDNLAANGRVYKYVPVGPNWRAISLAWPPSADSPNARLYVWDPQSKTTFRLRDVRVLALDADGKVLFVQRISLRLQGRIGTDSLEREESRFLRSRWEGLRLSLRAFASHPLRGIGWEQLPTYTASHSRYGNLASHNEYARVVAELGLPGLLTLAAAAAALVAGAARTRRSPFRSAALGVVAAGAVGLLFINGLVAAAASLPLAVAAGLLVSTTPGESSPAETA
jgi:O-antigen ligase